MANFANITFTLIYDTYFPIKPILWSEIERFFLIFILRKTTTGKHSQVYLMLLILNEGWLLYPPPESPFPKNQPPSPPKKTQETPKKISKCNSSYAFYKEVKKATKWFPHESIANFHLAGYFLVCPGYQAPLTFREFWKTYLFRLILKRAKVVELSTLLFS